MLLNVLPIVSWGSVFVFVLICITLCPFYCCNPLEEEERAGCIPFIGLRMFCYCKFSVAFPNGVVGWSAVCTCGIS